jgi:hypothetical protein
MKLIELECSTCKRKFEKPMNEYRRRIKLGKTDFYCSISCGAKSDTNLQMIHKVSVPYRFKGGENKMVTEEQKVRSSMKEFAKRVRNRKKKFFEELDIEKLVEIWEDQKGKCRITNVNLVLQHQPNYKTISNNYKASIDRIDSSKPYSIDNIQFISFTCNSMKSNMTNDEVYEFLYIVKNIKKII